jgi:hypothetical protein
MISVALFSVIIGCGKVRTIVKTHIDSTSTVKAKTRIDSTGNRKLDIDSLKLYEQMFHGLKYSHRTIVVYDTTHKVLPGEQQRKISETTFDNGIESTAKTGLSINYRANEIDSSHTNRYEDQSIVSHVKKYVHDKSVKTGFSLPWQAWCLIGLLLVVAGVIWYLKKFIP